MKVIDNYRAQYYQNTVRLNSEKFLSFCIKNPKSITNVSSIIEGIETELAKNLDQIILPTIVHEIHASKPIVGQNPEQRYYNFFVNNNKWSKQALEIPIKYSQLFNLIKIYVEITYKNFIDCIQYFISDLQEISKFLRVKDQLIITNIDFLSSDRHKGGEQAVLLTLNNTIKIIYKPTSLLPEQVFADYVSFIGLKSPYDLKTVKVIDKNLYGWIEYIAHKPVEIFDEISIWYKKAGVLLALADSLNYTDGHFDNIISHGQFPVLIDCESLFHVFGIEIKDEVMSDHERSILLTGLVQKPPKINEGRGFTAGLQTPSRFRFEFLQTHAINDGTDNIEVRFQGIVKGESHNLPLFKNQYISPNNFVFDFVEGYQAQYLNILKNREELMNNASFWKKVKSSKFRQIVRSTLYYQWLIRKMEQPDLFQDHEGMIKSITTYLVSQDYDNHSLIEYEIQDLIRRDIPYFYHFVETCSIYDSHNVEYSNFTKKSAFEEVISNISCMSLTHMNRNIQILKNILPLSSKENKPIILK
jgi:type 2 lantibiotic biosynthesis protein LanM